MQHDNYFKKSLEDPDIAKEFLETHLPNEIKKIIDVASFKISKESFIEDGLKSKFVDVLFKSEKNQYILILLEHQSTPDHFTAFKLLKYNCNIWDKYLKDNPGSKELPLIYNIVFYNGRKPFNCPRSMFDLIKNQELAKKFLFKLQLIDTKDMSDKELQAKPHAGFMQFFMKYIYSENMIKIWQKVSEIFDFKKLKINYLSSTLCYTIGRIDENDQDKLYEIIDKEISTKEGENLMVSLAQKWLEEGKIAGIQEMKPQMEKIARKSKKEAIEKIAKSMILRGDSDQEVVDMTSLTIKEVISIKKSLKDSES